MMVTADKLSENWEIELINMHEPGVSKQLGNPVKYVPALIN